MTQVKNEPQSFKKEEIEHLSKLRIIQKNLVHVHGFPKSLAKINTFKSKNYFGLYGNIVKIKLSFKINPDNNKKVYSAYITYSNEREAAYAVLCVDSLLIQGKIIRVFFGTTKYCNNFLNNTVCKNLDNCKFLHKLIDDKDIIVDDNKIFTYDDHINLAKEIINYSDPKMKDLALKMKKPKNLIFPFFDFIYLSEEEKENYFTQGNISYFRSNSIESKNNKIDNYDCSKIELKSINSHIINSHFEDRIDNIADKYELNNFYFKDNSININIINNEKKINVYNDLFEPNEFHNLINNSLNHIFSAKPFYSNIKNIPLKKLELDYFKKALEKENKNFNKLFEGCLDCLNDII